MKIHSTSYWISTSLLNALMLFAAFAYLTDQPLVTHTFGSMGFPRYFPAILGGAKLLGVIVLLAPRWVLLKEWAYAGFTFIFLGALLSHLASGQGGAAFPPLIALTLLLISYTTRPLERRLMTRTSVQEVDGNGHVHTKYTLTSAR